MERMEWTVPVVTHSNHAEKESNSIDASLCISQKSQEVRWPNEFDLR